MNQRYSPLGGGMLGRMGPQPNRPQGRGCGLRLIIALVMAAVSLISYFGATSFNPITNENQHVSITPDQEIALGLQASPEMIQQYGGLDSRPQGQDQVARVGERVVRQSDAAASNYPFKFNLLADNQTVNAFALPGGPVFITDALLQRLETEGQLAGVLGHEAGHVVARHSAQQIAQQQLSQGLTGAVVMATYDPNDPRTQQTAQVAMIIASLVNLKYGRSDELQSDQLGVRFMSQAGYDPRALIRVMQILAEASGGSSQPEFLSTHPDPGNRQVEIQRAIDALYPNGVPQGLTP